MQASHVSLGITLARDSLADALPSCSSVTRLASTVALSAACLATTIECLHISRVVRILLVTVLIWDSDTRCRESPSA